MNRADFIKLIGAESANAEFLPVAFLLRSGYGCAGHYNSALNEELQDTCVLLNARLIEIRQGQSTGHRPTIQDFNEFLEEIVLDFYELEDAEQTHAKGDLYAKPIPLTAIPFEEISVIYPVPHMGTLMQRVKEEKKRSPRFLDFDKSVILRLLRTKLW